MEGCERGVEEMVGSAGLNRRPPRGSGGGPGAPTVQVPEEEEPESLVQEPAEETTRLIQLETFSARRG